MVSGQFLYKGGFTFVAILAVEQEKRLPAAFALDDHAGFLEFKDVVKKNQVASAGPTAAVPSGDKIGEAAKKLSDAIYPFLKEVDWLSDL